MNPNDINDDMFPGEDDTNEEELWFEAPGDKPEKTPDDAPDYNFRDDARRTYTIVGSIIAVFVFFGVLGYLYYQKNLRDTDNPPVITAEEGPVRERPEDPGGMEVPHQDKLIFGKVDGEGTEVEDAVLPGPEQPMNDIAINDIDGGKTIEDLIQETEPAPTQPSRQAEAEPVVSAPAAANGGGGFMIQLGAFSERRIADNAWATAQNRHGALLAGLTADIDAITTSSGRTLFRLRAGYFETRPTAERVCGQLKQQGQDCLVTAR